MIQTSAFLSLVLTCWGSAVKRKKEKKGAAIEI